MDKRAHRGFTLIELLIVMVVLAIIVAIAVPSYGNFVRKARRATAQGCLLEISQFMERNYTAALRYDEDAGGNAVAIPPLDCTTELNGFYNFALQNLTRTTFTVAATAIGDQDADACGNMSITHTGVKSPLAPAECWR